MTAETLSLDALPAWTQRLADTLTPGDVIALSGTLGAGKTTLVQHLAKGLGITERVTSPTFNLMNDYLSGRVPFIHVDLYRLGPEGADGLADELLGVIAEKAAVVAVEWAEYGSFLDTVITHWVKIDVLPDECRQVMLTLKDS